MADAGAAGRGRGARSACAGSTPTQPRRNVPRAGGVAAVRGAAGGVTADDHAHRHRRRHRPRAALRRADRRAGRGVPLRHRRAGQDRAFHPAAVGQRGQGAADAGLDQLRRAVHRLQARQRVSRQRQAQQAGGARQLRADVRRHRRDARGDGRRGAHRLAHRLRLRARGALSRARGCLASRHDRRRRAGAASHPRAPRRCGRSTA